MNYNNNGLSLYYLAQKNSVQKQQAADKREKNAQENTSVVSRFFSFMLALVSLKTDTPIAATTRTINPTQTKLPTAGKPQAIPAAAPAPTHQPTQVVKTAAPLPSIQNKATEHRSRTRSQTSVSFFKAISNWYKNYAKDLDTEDCDLRKLQEKHNPTNLAQKQDEVDTLLPGPHGINARFWTPGSRS